MIKFCEKCGDFTAHRRNGALKTRCKVCARKWRRRDRENNRAKHNAIGRIYRKRHPEQVKQWERKNKGLPAPTRPEPDVCEGCKKPPGRKGICLDHDHITGVFRGWLCSKCNLGIGLLGDTIGSLLSAVDYLTRNTEVNIVGKVEDYEEALKQLTYAASGTEARIIAGNVLKKHTARCAAVSSAGTTCRDSAEHSGAHNFAVSQAAESIHG